MWNSMLCVDSLQDLSVQGGLFSAQAKVPEISVDRCVDLDDVYKKEKLCKADTEIDDLINDIVILYAYNTQIYRPDVYGDLTVANSVKIGYLPL